MKTLNGKIKSVRATCARCGETSTFMAKVSDIVAWQNGEAIEEVLSYLSDDERELLLSKTCGKCFDEMFKDWD